MFAAYLVQLLGLTLVSILIYSLVRNKLRYSERNKQLSKLREAPIRNLPLIGQLWYFLLPNTRFVDKLDILSSKLGTPCVLWLTKHFPIVLLTKADDIERLAIQCTNREMFGVSEGTLNSVLALQSGDKWNRSRRLLNPAFGTIMMTQYLKVFDKQGRTLADMLEPEATTGKVFDMHPFLRRLTGVDKEIEKLRAFTTAAIREGRKSTTGIIESEMKTIPEHSEPKLAIDFLFAAHDRDPTAITEDYIRDEVLQFNTTALETSLGIGHLMLMLAIHQDTQEKVYHEILNTISDGNQQITMENMNQLHYLDQCLKETLRRLNIIPTAPRQTLTSTTLPSGEIIPADTIVLLHYKNVNDNAAFYPDPASWNPDNYSPEAIASRPQNSFTTFGLGNRVCIGAKFSVLAMKSQAIHILRRYRVYTPLKLDEIVYDRYFVPRIRCGYPIRLEARNTETPTAF